MNDELHKLVQALQNPDLYPHPVDAFSIIETHISIVLIAGDYAYKFKKPVNLGFLDFSTLEKRRFYCTEELRLNKRLAPDLYLEVVTITEGPELNGTGTAIEYAVRMRAFDQNQQFDRLLADDKLENSRIDALARKIASFHQTIAVAGMDTPFGNPDSIRAPVTENFEQILSRLHNSHECEQLQVLQAWSDNEFNQRHTEFVARKQNGFVRECHGDLHLRNVTLFNNDPVAFDCIEFSENLRWIDVISEIAFMVMDLDDRKQVSLASRFLNTYLEHTGDYAGLVLLRYYLVYRAMVRAKVDCIRTSQPDLSPPDKASVHAEFLSYLELAEKYTRAGRPHLILMHGLSGSGKTTVSQHLLEQLPAIRIRSDVERKRLFGLTTENRTDTVIDQGLYSKQASEQTYARLKTLAATILECGLTVVVDAAFLKINQRTNFAELARQLKLPLTIVDCQAPEEEMQRRLLERQSDTRDASDANIDVLEHQLRTSEALTTKEADHTITIDTTQPDKLMQLTRIIHEHELP